MALWADPLDELIAELERGFPTTQTQPEWDSNRSLIGLQKLTSAIMYGTPEDVERVSQDPDVQYSFRH